MSEATFWIAYSCAFVATLVLGLAFKRRLWLISVITAACSSAALFAISIWLGGEMSDLWLPVGLFINFGMSWAAAAAAIYFVKLIRA